MHAGFLTPPVVPEIEEVIQDEGLVPVFDVAVLEPTKAWRKQRFQRRKRGGGRRIPDDYDDSEY